jgi:3-deoxy-D-manno-octulosonic-acid transferase
MMRALYSLVVWLVQPLLRRKLARRARVEPGYAHAVEQRFGDYAALPLQPGSPWVWVHAVSLGETRAAAVLVARLRRAYPGMRLLLTHGTATGWAQGTALLQEGDVQTWQPWDTPGAVQRFLQHFQPCLGLLIETEVWPNLVAGCAAQKVPLCLVNARLSAKSLRQAQRLRRLAEPAYRGLRAVWAQTEADAVRLRALGAPVVGVTGNFKFDADPDPVLLQRGRSWHDQGRKPVVLFASSREGEETLFLQALQRLGTPACAQVQWLLVPRHPQRFDEVAGLVEASGLTLSRRSTWTDAPAPAAVWLGDSLGEMPFYFGLADIALLGGSFAPLGGQNLIEAAACGCPLVMGPHTFNFAEAAEQAALAGAAFGVANLAAGLTQVLALLGDPQQLAQARQQAMAWSQAHRGATERTVQALAPYLTRLASG